MWQPGVRGKEFRRGGRSGAYVVGGIETVLDLPPIRHPVTVMIMGGEGLEAQREDRLELTDIGHAVMQGVDAGLPFRAASATAPVRVA